MTSHEGHRVVWAKYGSFLLPAERSLSLDEFNRRTREAFAQSQQVVDPDKAYTSVVASKSELSKIKDILD